jgi:hypothetical protein
MRKIEIYHTGGINGKEIKTDVTTWGELKSVLSGHGISTDNVEAVNSTDFTSFENDVAVLPKEDFVLYMNPKAKVKSGAEQIPTDFRASFKAWIGQNPDKKDAFKEDGKNWTTLGTNRIYEICKKRGFNLNGISSSTKEEKVETIVETIVEKKEDSASFVDKLSRILEEDSISKIHNIVRGLLAEVDNICAEKVVETKVEETKEDVHKANLRRLFGK